MDDKLPLGMVGLHFGRHIIDCHLRSGPGEHYFQLAAVCDLDEPRRRQAAERYGVPACASLDELLGNPGIPVIGLFTGPTRRAELIARCIRAGKHVMTTKPLETNPDAALAVLQEAKRLGRVVHLNSPSPLPSYYLQQIITWQREHNLGQPVGARSEVWAHYHEKPDGTWYDDPVLCPVAPILRLGIYGINDLCRLLGEPESVQVMHSRLFTQRPTPDNAHLTIRFSNGSLASVYASFCTGDRPGYQVALHVNYERGSVWYDEDGLRLRTLATGTKPIRVEVPSPGISGEYQWEAFARAVRGEKLEGELTPEQAIASSRVLKAMAVGQADGVMVRV